MIPNFVLSLIVSTLSAVTAQNTGPSNCSPPRHVSGDTLFPWLIVPVQRGQPDTAFGTQKSITAYPGQDVIIQYTVQNPRPQGTCSLQLALPPGLTSWTLTGDRVIQVKKIQQQITTSTTWNNLGDIDNQGQWQTITANPNQNNLQVIFSDLQCDPGNLLTFAIRAPNAGTKLDVFENNACPTTGVVVIFNGQLGSS